jgi:CTP:molybdopterin cytidylyltransferase MocA
VSVAAILLAGGESSRMGQPKALLEWSAGQTLIEYQIDELRQPPVERVVVVLGYRANDIRPFAEKVECEVVVNELYERGRASSLRMGARALPEDTRTIVILDVDQPRPRIVIQRLIENHIRASSMITVPTFDGQRGHPTIIDGWLLPELRRVRERTQGLRGLLEAHEPDIVEVPFESDIVLLGMNTPAEYEDAKAKYFSHEIESGFRRSKEAPNAGHDSAPD